MCVRELSARGIGAAMQWLRRVYVNGSSRNSAAGLPRGAETAADAGVRCRCRCFPVSFWPGTTCWRRLKQAEGYLLQLTATGDPIPSNGGSAAPREKKKKYKTKTHRRLRGGRF